MPGCRRSSPTRSGYAGAPPGAGSAPRDAGAIAAVQGIWTSFRMVEGLELGVKSFAFSTGLSHALLPLAISLVSAVLLMLPFGILDAIAWRLESEMEHSLCVVLNILSPEMQPMFTGGASSSGNQEESSDNYSGGNAANENVDRAESKGKKDDSSDPCLQEVPDEEEII